MSLIDARYYPYTQTHIDLMESRIREKLKNKNFDDEAIRKILTAILDIRLIGGGMRIEEFDSIIDIINKNTRE